MKMMPKDFNNAKIETSSALVEITMRYSNAQRTICWDCSNILPQEQTGNINFS